MVEFGPCQKGEISCIGQVTADLLNRMRNFGGARFTEARHMFFAPETYSHAAMEMCLESGVELLFHARFVDCIVKGNRIEGILVSSKEGMHIYAAHTYIDCSGDGDVFASAGLPWKMGRDSDGLAQPMTLVFFVNDVNYEKFMQACDGDIVLYFQEVYKKAKGRGEVTIPITRPGSIGPVPRYGRNYDPSCCEVFINSTNVLNKSGINAKELSEAECFARKQVYELFNFYKNNIPGFEYSYLSFVPTAIGVRETRRLTGSYVLTKSDMINQIEFEDTIAIGFNQIDVHQVNGQDFDLIQFPKNRYYNIPYRCLHTKEMSNLLVAGRCISVDHEALGAVRVMVNTMPIAEAAGIAAALCVQNNTEVYNVPMDVLKHKIKRVKMF